MSSTTGWVILLNNVLDINSFSVTHPPKIGQAQVTNLYNVQVQDNMDITTISIEKNVRDRLKRCGNEDESYNSIIERLLDLYEEFEVELEQT